MYPSWVYFGRLDFYVLFIIKNDTATRSIPIDVCQSCGDFSANCNDRAFLLIPNGFASIVTDCPLLDDSDVTEAHHVLQVCHGSETRRA